jgi:hypothetical protein
MQLRRRSRVAEHESCNHAVGAGRNVSIVLEDLVDTARDELYHDVGLLNDDDVVVQVEVLFPIDTVAVSALEKDLEGVVEDEVVHVNDLGCRRRRS